MTNIAIKYDSVLPPFSPVVDANGLPLDDAQGAALQTRGHLEKSPLDEGKIARPVLSNLYEVRSFPGEKSVLFASPYGQRPGRILKGELYLKLLPLIDGQRNADSIVEQLAASGADSMSALIALNRLSALGLIVSGEHRLPEEAQLFWGELGLTPRVAQERLEALPLWLEKLGGQPCQGLSEQLKGVCGFHFAGKREDAALIIYTVENYFRQEEAIAECNSRHLGDKKAWLLYSTDRDIPLFGPIFHPAKHPRQTNRPCWECLNFRLKRGGRGLQSFFGPHKPGRQSVFGEATTRERFCLELGMWVVNQISAPLGGQMVLTSPRDLLPGYHWVGQRPQCRACGDRGLLDFSREARPPRLQARAFDTFTSGGVRTLSCQAVLDKFKKFVSPISGPVAYLNHISDKSEPDPAKAWFCTAQSGENSAARQEQLKGLKMGCRQASGGKGDSHLQAATSALCESIERYSGVFQQEEELIRVRRHRDFKEGEGIAPNEIMLFSDDQYRRRKEINKMGLGFYQVPLPFDPDRELPWTPLWSLTQKRFKYVMTDQVYYRRNQSKNWPISHFSLSDSNGCAAGSSFEDAIIQGSYELFERDAFALWWYNRLTCPGLDLDSFDIPWLGQAVDQFRRLERNLWVLDISADFGVPVFVAVSRMSDPNVQPQVLCGAGAHLDARIAVMRAVSEMNQFLPFMSDESYIEHAPQAQKDFLTTMDPNKIDDPEHAWLAQRTDRPKKRMEDYPLPRHRDTLEAIEQLRGLFESKGLEMLVLDQTRPDIGLPVARVMVPGIRHFWCRLAPGRLYDVPVQMGWLKEKKREDELNPIPMFW